MAQTRPIDALSTKPGKATSGWYNPKRFGAI